jgi:hypothetical protein
MASSLCIAVLLGTAVHTLPTDRITLSWTHTVEKTRWEEDYRIVGIALTIEEARVKTSGAGMEPPRDATWSSGWWRYKPSIGLLKEVILANSGFASGYTICWANICESMRELVPRGEFIKIAPEPCGGMLEKDQALRDAIAE